MSSGQEGGRRNYYQLQVSQRGQWPRLLGPPNFCVLHHFWRVWKHSGLPSYIHKQVKVTHIFLGSSKYFYSFQHIWFAVCKLQTLTDCRLPSANKWYETDWFHVLIFHQQKMGRKVLHYFAGSGPRAQHGAAAVLRLVMQASCKYKFWNANIVSWSVAWRGCWACCL